MLDENKHTNIFDFYKVDSKKSNFTEIKEEEELCASQEFSQAELKMDHDSPTNKNISTGFGSDNEHDRTKKDQKADYFMVVDHIDEINQKLFFLYILIILFIFKETWINFQNHLIWIIA